MTIPSTTRTWRFTRHEDGWTMDVDGQEDGHHPVHGRSMALRVVQQTWHVARAVLGTDSFDQRVVRRPTGRSPGAHREHGADPGWPEQEAAQQLFLTVHSALNDGAEPGTRVSVTRDGVGLLLIETVEPPAQEARSLASVTVNAALEFPGQGPARRSLNGR